MEEKKKAHKVLVGKRDSNKPTKTLLIMGEKLFKYIGFIGVKWTEQADNSCG
jgi:hypothetical protein